MDFVGSFVISFLSPIGSHEIHSDIITKYTGSMYIVYRNVTVVLYLLHNPNKCKHTINTPGKQYEILHSGVVSNVRNIL